MKGFIRIHSQPPRLNPIYQVLERRFSDWVVSASVPALDKPLSGQFPKRAFDSDQRNSCLGGDLALRRKTACSRALSEGHAQKQALHEAIV